MDEIKRGVKDEIKKYNKAEHKLDMALITIAGILISGGIAMSLFLANYGITPEKVLNYLQNINNSPK